MPSVSGVEGFGVSVQIRMLAAESDLAMPV